MPSEAEIDEATAALRLGPGLWPKIRETVKATLQAAEDVRAREAELKNPQRERVKVMDDLPGTMMWRYTDDRMIRLECLRVALGINPGDMGPTEVIAAAGKLYEFLNAGGAAKKP